ncbi:MULTISPECIES: YihY/virulence factor BrkB family protein [Actinosynnema]|uniref:YihY/virulence factor BrkB family protein n=1 Tax=Actinosynnema TaxID=40566 RepID=UPI0012FD28FE|nr:YihY/virulence factor BrkB family protein [Actinosynnema pretiosum]
MFRTTVVWYREHHLSDRAAALTHYTVLVMLSGALLPVALVGFLGDDTRSKVMTVISPLAPSRVHGILVVALDGLRPAVAGPLAAACLLVAVWSAYRFAGAFLRACAACNGVKEHRSLWKLVPLRVGLTLGVLVLFILVVGVVAFTGDIADEVAALAGVRPSTVQLWDVAKWPVLVLLAGCAVRLLFAAPPATRRPGRLGITPGALLALVLCLVATFGVGVYAAYAGSYDRVYGSIIGLVVVMAWIWLACTALLVGVAMDAALQHTGRVLLAAQRAARQKQEGVTSTSAA